MSFQTVGQASGTDSNSRQPVGLTFDAHGTTSTSDRSQVDITNGTIQLQAILQMDKYMLAVSTGEHLPITRVEGKFPFPLQ
jgi:hypothetical protein